MPPRQPGVTFSVTRIEGYTDAVFAIAATLLVLDLTATSFGEISTEDQLWTALANMWPSFMSFGVSFALLSGLWVIHLRQFRDIARANMLLVWFNNARLLFIVLIPFTTSLTSEYQGFYAGRVLLPINFFFAALLGYLSYVVAASHDGALLREEARADAPAQQLGGLAAVICGAIAALLSPLVGSLGFLAFLLSTPVEAFLRRLRTRSPRVG